LIAAAGPASAQTAGVAAPGLMVAQAAQRDFAIPSQPLASALALFGRQSGVQVSYPSDVAASVNSPGISGAYSGEDALRALLNGTGVTYRFTGANSVTLERQTEGTLNIPAASVEAARPSDPGATEGTKSYAGSQASVGSKTPTTIREIPQSVSVVTRQRIEDRNFTTVDQAMKETTGMVTTQLGHGGHTIQSRGYDTQMQVDGLAVDSGGGLFGNEFDLAIYDRLEVLRGPSGLFMGGSGTPSGIVNYVHKRPTRNFAYGGAAGVGSWDYYRGEGDVSGPLFDSDRARVRLVVAGQDNDTFVDVTHQRRAVGYGSVEFDLTEQTTLLFGTAYQDRDAVHHGGLPAYTTGQLTGVDRSSFIGADWNRKDTNLSDTFVDLEHRFDSGAVARVAGRWLERSSFNKRAEGGNAINPTTNNVSLNALMQDDDQRDMGFDSYLSTPVTVLDQEHKLLIGADYRTTDKTTLFGRNNGFATVNVFSPSHNLAEPNIPITSHNEVETEQYGAYGQARIKPIDPLTLIVGGRFSWWDTKTTSLLTNRVTSNFSVEDQVTPYYGVIVDITDNLSVYGSYSDIFVPQSQTSVGGSVLPPRVGSQYEAGIKAELFDKNLIGHLAAFRIEDENRAMTDPANTSFSIAAGLVRAEGFEAELSGKLLPQLDVYAGYAYTNTNTIAGTAAQVGQVVHSWTPKHSFNLWTKYTFEHGALDGFNVGAGVKIASRTFAGSAPRVEQEAYTVASAQVGYALTDDILATLSVNNIFDKVYYERVFDFGSGNFYGEPRSVWFTIRKSF
jgi:outer membrane receptor for ferric coprogen and ferric-rhodotorulic acid